MASAWRTRWSLKGGLVMLKTYIMTAGTGTAADLLRKYGTLEAALKASGDEFCEGTVFCGTEEKIEKQATQRVGDDEF